MFAFKRQSCPKDDRRLPAEKPALAFGFAGEHRLGQLVSKTG